MQLRSLGAPDAPAYRALRLRGLREHPLAFTSSFEEESLRPLADSAKRLTSEDTSRIYGAWNADELIGIGGLSLETRLKNRHKGTLVGLYVAPEYAGRGLGRKLVEHLLGQAREAGLSTVVLTVTQGNAQARGLYQRCGFQSFGIEPDAIRVDGASYAKEHMLIQFPRAVPRAIA